MTVPSMQDRMAWRRTLNAILRMIGASAFFAAMGACVKGSTASLPFLVAVFFRSAVGLLPLLIYFRWTHASLRATQHGLLLLRSLFGFTAMCMFFLAIERLRLSTATVLNFTSPVFVVVLSGVFLKEKSAFKVLPLVLAAFAGVAVLVAPEFGDLTVEVVLGLSSAFFAALAYVTIKRLSRTESAPTIVLYFSIWSSVFGAVALAVSAAAGWTEVGLGHIVDVLGETRELLLLCGVGFFGTFGQILLTSAYARERASVVSPFSYMAPVFSYGVGLVLFGEVPSAEGVLGGALVIAASIGVLLLSREPVHRPDLRLDGEA
jgi:drug/metabolite transporter (DMT)-like permease